MVPTKQIKEYKMIIRMKKDVESMIEVIKKDITTVTGDFNVCLTQYDIVINPLVPEDADYIEVSVTHKRITEIEWATKVLSCQLYTEPVQPKVSLTTTPMDLSDLQKKSDENKQQFKSLLTDSLYEVIALDATKSKMTTAVLKDGDQYSGK